MRVVIADDADEIRLLLGLCLPEYGDFDVVAEASNGVEAVEAVRTHRPDLLLLDLSMPVMDGLTAAARIRQFDESVQIVVLSGFQAGAMALEAAKAGANHFLEKGLDLDVLAATLAAQCTRVA